MALQVVLSLVIIAATIFVHGAGTTYWLNHLVKKHGVTASYYGFARSMKILSFSAVFLMVLHFIEIMLWASVYLQIPELKNLGNWEEAIYFSTITYTTVGYGDITLPPVWRIMSGFEAMSGILLFGWSAAMFYAVVQKITPITKKNGEINK